MYLEKLEINGFKSFAHKISLEFKPGITGIVGPNGSGKSNVADAMRWVLGEQSIKTLRGKKSEDVIFSGSDKKARLGMAEVSLFFNNEQDKAGLDMTEIVITRKLYRNGESEYLINKQKSRLADISMLLARAGIARTSYSIIGQGMIDNFLLSSPQERQEFFEEAAGVKPLQIKRSQALNKLENTEENLETAAIQLNEITPRLNSLTRQVHKLEKRTAVEKELKIISQKYYTALWHEINTRYKNQSDELKKIDQQKQKISTQTNSLSTQIAELTKDNVKSDILQQLQENYQSLVDQKMQNSQKLSELKIKIIHTAQKQNTNQDLPPHITRQVIQDLDHINNLQQQTKTAFKNQDFKKAEELFNQQNELLEKIFELINPFKEKNKKSENTDNTTLHHNINQLEQEIDKINQQIETLTKQIKTENQKEKAERSQIWQVQQELSIKQQTLNQISNNVNDLRVELARIETRLDDLEQDIRRELDDNTLEQIKITQADNLNQEQKHELFTHIGKLKHQLELIGGIDPEIQNEYEQTATRHSFLFEQITDLKKSIDSLEKLIIELDENIKKQFDASFKIINEQFQQHFKTLFAGGHANLKLIKEQDIDHQNKINMAGEELANNDTDIPDLKNDSEFKKIKNRLKTNSYLGVEIEATPPGKKLKSINMLSGGERAMTSIALLCAILSANPSPFVVLDEVDAALDEANSLRYAEIIEQLANKSQFIIITHNRATMEKADVLYGVTMGADGVSALLSLKLESAEQYTNR